MRASRIRVSTPGRVCLFGEHQDYLGLPVIAAAISVRMTINVASAAGRHVRLALPDLRSSETFELVPPIAYTVERDYVRSTVNVLSRHGFTWSRGLEGEVRGTIPINAGTSSSSALIVTWAAALAQMSDQGVFPDPADLAHMAWEAEVKEFDEPGGKMDHVSTALGGTVHITFGPKTVATRLTCPWGTFVLGNSNEPKNTKGILARVKDGVLACRDRLRKTDPTFDLSTAVQADLDHHRGVLSEDEYSLLGGTLRNRDLTREALALMAGPFFDHGVVGALMNEHQQILRDICRISTPKIDRMIDAALGAGALGAKINGSGGGGCMFAYAPDDPAAVAEAIAREGGTPTIVSIDDGVRLELAEHRD